MSHKALRLIGLHCLCTRVHNVYSKIIAIQKIAEAKLKKKDFKKLHNLEMCHMICPDGNLPVMSHTELRSSRSNS